MPKVRHEIEVFAQFMEHKLKLNDHKGGWEEKELNDRLKLLKEEVIELEEALVDESHLDIVFEAADIANFAMMIAWNALRGATLKEQDIDRRKQP